MAMADRSKTKRIALCGVLAALSLALMLLAGVLPTSSYALAAMAGIVMMPIVTEFGPGAAASCFSGVAVLSLLLVADKEVVLLFLCFLGWFPICKSRLDFIRPLWLGYLCRTGIFAVAAAAFYFATTRLLGITLDFGETVMRYGFAAVAVLLLAVFLVYDVAVSKLYLFYDIKLRAMLHKILYS